MSLSVKDNVVMSSPSLHGSDDDSDDPPQRQTSAPFDLAQKERSRLNSRRRSLSPSSNSSLRSSRSSAIPTSIPESNHSIDNYQLGKTIGKGNFAKVKVATHTITGTEVAVKIIDKNNMSESSLAKLLREVKIMKMLRHPNIVELYEVIETEDTLYLIMEYASGGEVFDFLVEHGRMKEKVARQKFRQILSAVEYCHAQGIVHRDLKAENLLLDHDMNVKIADFGFSNYYSVGVKLDTFCGSPPYAAPELFQGKKYDGPEVDVWSLGVILYTLVSGSLPFDGANLKELRERVLRGKYRIPFYMSEECEQLLRKFLVLVPSRRMSLRAVLDAEWINLESEQLTPHVNPDLSEDGFNINALAEMLKVGFVRESIEEAVRGEEFDHVHATYELFSRKHPDTNELEDEVFTPPPTKIQRPQSVGSERIGPMLDLNTGSTSTTLGTNKIDESDSDLLQTPREKPRLTRRATDGVAQRVAKQKIKEFSHVNDKAVTAVQPAPVQQLAEMHLRGRSDSPQQPPQRKNSFMRRRFSRSVVQPNASPIKIGNAEPRVLRFTFSRTNTTDKPPKELMRDVTTVLEKNKVQYQQQEPFVLVCAFGEELRFEIEICKLARLSMHGIKHKRIAGESLGYKNICTKILNDLNM
eukprot:m.117649 g.117649  ORF g.117649 m.117649 type:complete len:639 (-) comp28593_c0_seq3:314-2230(-)